MNSDFDSNPSQPDSSPQYSSPNPYDDDMATAELVRVGASPEPRTRLSLSGWVAWAFVIFLTLFLFSTVAVSQFTKDSAVGGDASSTELMQVQMQAKAAVGQKRFTEAMGQPVPEEMKKVPTELDTGSFEQRLCFAILKNELESPEAALEYLEELETKVESSNLELTEDQTNMRDSLKSLFQDYRDGSLEEHSLTSEEQKLVEDRLEWVGKLAFLPAGSSREASREKLVGESDKMMVVGLVGLIGGGLLGMVGLGLAIMFMALASTRKLKAGFIVSPTNHNIYIETFAVWMAMFFGSSILMGFAGIESPKFAMLVQPFVFFGSLLALLWPLFRGLSWQQVREDIGWTSERPVREIFSAIPIYLATLPFLVPGVVMITILMNIVLNFKTDHEFARPEMPSHPVQEYIMNGGVSMILLVFLTACVAAPIVEETMFRGVLYRHLRGLSSRCQRWASVMFSAIINGLIFASIHPQGIYGIPVLASLAIGFSLAREWRGSLISSMVMHAIHNTVITCISLLIL